MDTAELGFHSAVDGTATVSLEDATTLTTALATGPRRSPACTSGCGCSMTWVPYIQTTRSESSIEPFDRRIDGMLYVGGMHGLAVLAMEWLLQKVQPLIASSAGEAELLKGGKGHLHLAGPGWGQQWAGSSVINKSVAAGHVSVLGILSDMQLDQRLQDHKVFVAPVLNGTGIATKNVLAMAHGIPLVTTLVGLNGLGLPNEQRAILVGDSPSAFAHHVLKVQSSEKVFSTTWRAALEHTRTYLSADRQRSQLCQMMGCTSQPAAAAVRPTETTRKVGLCEAADTQLRRAADTPPTAGSPAASPVVLLGLAGTNVSSLAAALRSPRVCLVADPLQGLQRAPCNRSSSICSRSSPSRATATMRTRRRVTTPTRRLCCSTGLLSSCPQLSRWPRHCSRRLLACSSSPNCCVRQRWWSFGDARLLDGRLSGCYHRQSTASKASIPRRSLRRCRPARHKTRRCVSW